MSRYIIKKHVREAFELARESLIGGHVVLDTTRKHPVMTMSYGGQIRTVRMSGTPGCDTQRAVFGDIRKKVLELTNGR